MIRVIQLPHARVLQIRLGRLSALIILDHARPGSGRPRLDDPADSGERTAPPDSRYRFFWTLGHGLMLLSVMLFLYVGGVYAQAGYRRQAARGDTPLPAPRPVAIRQAALEPFVAPILQASARAGDERITGEPPGDAQAAHRSTVSRVMIPSIGVDSKVVEVGWDVYVLDGQSVAVWQVAEYAVGHHRGSANPGERGNIVLAGHVGGFGMVFRELFNVQPGDPITLYSDGQEYRYVVEERLVLAEEGVAPEQRAENARYIGPADHELLTLVTCWPPDLFTERVVVRAMPFRATLPSAGSWSVR